MGVECVFNVGFRCGVNVSCAHSRSRRYYALRREYLVHYATTDQR